jgi:arsenate reductase
MTVKIYQYPGCSTCKRALKWLDGRGVSYESIHIVDSPPAASVLRKARLLAEVPTRKLFNTAGQSYRNGNWKARIAEVSDADAIAALAADGKLIKRPLVIADDFALIGFKEAEWSARFGG